MTFITTYALPQAIARAHACRHYTALQLEAHAEALERMARMSVAPAAPAAPQPTPTPLPAPPSAHVPSPAIPNAQATAYMEPLTLARIIKHEVAAEFGLTISELLCDRRVASFVAPRMTAMWLHREFLTATWPAIGRSFKLPDGTARDHTTVIHACRMVAIRLECDPAYAARVARIRENIRITQAMIAAGKADAPVAEVPAPVKKTPSTMRYVRKTSVLSMDPNDVRKRAYRAAKKAIRVKVEA